ANEAPVQLTDNGTGPWTWLPDDSIAMAWEGRINRMAVDGGQATQMLAADEQHFVFGPALCGADHIAFNLAVANSPRNSTIWIANLDGSNRRQLTHGKLDFTGMCSADGKWLVYYDQASGRALRIATAGGEPLELFQGQVNSVDISPDSKQIMLNVFAAGQPPRREMRLLDIETGKQVATGELDLRSTSGTRYTPDGKE